MSKSDELEALKRRIESELVCPLKDSAKNLVFGKGNCDAKILFIGEAPGEKEDLEGVPFVGSAGKQLDKLLHGIGLCLDDVYIANILKYRPPNNRAPSVDEIKRHTPFLIEQIKIIQPKVVMTLGNYATKFVLANFSPDNMKSIEGTSVLHGKPKKMDIEGLSFTIVPCYHPAAVLYNPKLLIDLQNDFKVARQVIDSEL